MGNFFTKLLSESGDVSSKRFVMVLCAIVLCAIAITMTVGMMQGHTYAVFDTVITSIAALAGGAYVGGVAVEKIGQSLADKSDAKGGGA